MGGGIMKKYWGNPFEINAVILPHARCKPMHAYLGVSLVDEKRTYCQVNMYSVVLFLRSEMPL